MGHLLVLEGPAATGSQQPTRVLVQWYPATADDMGDAGGYGAYGAYGSSGGYGAGSGSSSSSTSDSGARWGRCVLTITGRDGDPHAVAVSQPIDASEMGHLVFDLFVTDGDPFIQVYHGGADVTERQPTTVRCLCEGVDFARAGRMALWQ